jgi:glyoxylase-like metal-dependent hydrolase (beta-lactamase superfamily II)
MQLTSPRSAFAASRLNATTFLIKELDDIYDEYPFIYVKVIPEANVCCLVDTGCGGVSKDPDVEVTSLRQFIETVAVPDNDYKPLNNDGKEYIVICTHVHYDHIREYGVQRYIRRRKLTDYNSRCRGL